MQLYRGDYCESRESQEYFKRTGTKIDPCHQDMLFWEEADAVRGCAGTGMAANYAGPDVPDCQYLHPEPGVTVDMLEPGPRDKQPPFPGMMQAEYHVLAKNTRIPESNDWFIACLVQPSGQAMQADPPVQMSTSQRVGAFCLKNTDRTQNGVNTVLERCDE